MGNIWNNSNFAQIMNRVNRSLSLPIVNTILYTILHINIFLLSVDGDMCTLDFKLIRVEILRALWWNFSLEFHLYQTALWSYFHGNLMLWHRPHRSPAEVIYMYIYIYIVYMWQMSSVFSHESVQRNDAGHLIEHGHFATNGFVFPLFRQMIQNTEKSTLNLWIVVNRKKCKRFLNSKPITRRWYIHTFIYERSFLACQTFQISNFTSEYTPGCPGSCHLVFSPILIKP